MSGEHTSARPRLDWLDIAKGIAIALVIVGHTVDNLSPVRQVIFSFHMPLFFILAGYTFRVKPMRALVTTSAQRLLVPYVLLFVIWRITQFFIQNDALTAHNLASLALTFIFASGVEVEPWGIPAVGMSWFLVCLFVARVVMNAVQSALEKRSVPIAAQCALYCAIALVGYFIGSIEHWRLPLSFDVALMAMLMMWVGYQAKRTRFAERFGLKWYVFLAAAVIWVLAIMFSRLEMSARIYEMMPLALLGAFSGTLLCCQLSMVIDKTTRLVKRVFVFMGRNSMLIYCFHAIDWLVPWMSLPLLQNVPLHNICASLLRILCDTSLAFLAKRV